MTMDQLVIIAQITQFNLHQFFFLCDFNDCFQYLESSVQGDLSPREDPSLLQHSKTIKVWNAWDNEKAV